MGRPWKREKRIQKVSVSGAENLGGGVNLVFGVGWL